MQPLSFVFPAILLLVLVGCQQDSKTGIKGNNNNDNQVAITEKGDVNINKGNININEKPKTIAETGIVPEDILTKIHPGVSLAFTKGLLGEAKIRENYGDPGLRDMEAFSGKPIDREKYGNRPFVYVWNFNNASIQVLTKDNNSIDVITLIKQLPNSADTFTIYPLNYKLGNLRYADLKCNDSPKKDYSSKFYSIYINCYFGNPGNYYNFEFGAYEGGSVKYEGKMVEYGGKIADDFWTTPFNYVSLASSGHETMRINWTYLR